MFKIAAGCYCVLLAHTGGWMTQVLKGFFAGV